MPRLGMIPSVASEPVRKLLSRTDLDPGTLAIEMVKAQVEHHQTRKNRHTRKEPQGALLSLLETAARTIVEAIGDDAEESLKSMESLPINVLGHLALKLETVPYEMFCRMMQASDEFEANADEWVLRNEVWLREISTYPGQRAGSPEKDECKTRGVQPFHWGHGLVRLSVHADIVFFGSVLTENCRIITRPTSLAGFKILDGRRPSSIQIQPSVERFKKAFQAMTGSLLKGLDWNNVFVAGGIVLGTLLWTANSATTSDITNGPQHWKNSDIDIYIHGLGPAEANKKIEHIFSVFKNNLGKNMPSLVVRNAKTITFFSEYPIRRVQVVLKLVESPKEVLLNFDLDICAMGWDGQEVWMLPRAARALKTGYTIFTMDLINGHYLGDRRATQEQRVFKYADRGFGICFLSSYLEECGIITNDPEKRLALDIQNLEEWHQRDFKQLVEDARKWTNTLIKGITKSQDNGALPTISHFLLQEESQNCEEPPRRSALSGLSLFMRHVALWEEEIMGSVIIDRNVWAAPLYDEVYFNNFGISYNDTPDYSWDGKFTTEAFIKKMAEFNRNEFQRFTENVDELLYESGPTGYRASLRADRLKDFVPKDILIQRISHANSVKEILRPEGDIYLPTWLPKKFVDFANDLISQIMQKLGVLPDHIPTTFMRALKNDFPATRAGSEGLQLVIWHITSITMWQQLDRAIDEVYEVLWAFHHANAGLVIIERAERMRLLVSQFGRRAIRVTAHDEYGEFARWVARKPAPFYNYYDPYFRFLAQDDEEEG